MIEFQQSCTRSCEEFTFSNQQLMTNFVTISFAFLHHYLILIYNQQLTMKSYSTVVISTFMLLFFQTVIAQQVSAQMSLSFNKKYHNAGITKIDLTSLNASLGWNPRTYKVTFIFSFTDTVITGIFLTLNDFNVGQANKRIGFKGNVQSFTQTGFQLNVYSTSPALIRVLSFRYFVYTKKLVDDYNWRFLSVERIVNQAFSEYKVTIDLINPISTLGGLQFKAYLSGFDLNCVENDSAGISRSLGFTSTQSWTQKQATNFVLKVFQTGSPYYIYNLYLSIFIWNTLYYLDNSEVQILTSKYSNYYLNPSYPYITNTSGVILQDTDNLYFPSYILGISQIQGNQLNAYFNLEMYYKTPDRIWAFAYNDKSYQITYKINILKFRTYYCSFKTPYFYKQQNLCYNLCPSETKNDESSLTCITAKCTSNCTPNKTVDPTLPNQPLLPIQPKESSQSNGSKLALIIFATMTGILIIIIVSYCCYQRKTSPKEQIKIKKLPNQEKKQALTPRTNQNQVIKDEIQVFTVPSSSKLGIWNQGSALPPNQVCSICRQKKPLLMAECNHFFHIQCFMEWCKKRTQCPTCKKNIIEQKSHLVCCTFCKLRHKWVSFRELKEKWAANILNQDHICSYCKLQTI